MKIECANACGDGSGTGNQQVERGKIGWRKCGLEKERKRLRQRKKNFIKATSDREREWERQTDSDKAKSEREREREKDSEGERQRDKGRKRDREKVESVIFGKIEKKNGIQRGGGGISRACVMEKREREMECVCVLVVESMNGVEFERRMFCILDTDGT